MPDRPGSSGSVWVQGMGTEARDYTAKRSDYFHGERRDFIDKLDKSSTRQILEIGCGDGATGAYAKREGKCGTYIGIELFPEAARIADGVLDQVFVANIETFDLPDQCGLSDVLIASEVLEHLIDPLAVLRKLRRRLTPGALVFASSPNIAHHSTLRMLIAGEWDLADSGRMDRTHMRWFTPKTYASLFEDAGFEVLSVRPLIPFRRKARIVNFLTGNRYQHLFVSQIVLEARRRPD